MSTALTEDLERRKLVRLRIRPDLGITPQKYEGKTHYVVKDPVGLKYYRFNEQEFFVVKYFDGKHTLEDTQKAFEKEFRPHRLTLEDLESFAQQLLTAGLAQHESAQAGKQLYEKRRKQRRLQTLATWSNILYIKLPVFDPDKILAKMAKKLWWIFTFWFFAASVALMLSAVLLVTTHFQTFWDRLPDYHSFFQFNRLMYMWIALGVVKVIHEFGHGLSCKAFGGECHEMGALFLCLSPCLYCNVSDSWTLPSKWKRIIISFAGIYVELVIAAIATWVWWNTPGRPTINNIALCIMVLCSISTFVFNANPLMRFDGYYILADWLEIPNLRDRSNRLLKNLTCEYGLGMEVQPEPYMVPWRQGLFVAYAVGSYVYRWVVTFSILYFLSNWLKPYKLGSLSAALALAALASMVGWPLYRLGKGLHKRGRLPDMKRLNVSISTSILAALLLAFFLVPLPISRVRQAGLVQIDPACTRKVTLPEDAILTALYIQDGQRVFEGQQLAVFRSPKLESDLAGYRSYCDSSRAEVFALTQAMRDAKDVEERHYLEVQLEDARATMNSYRVRMDYVQEEINRLSEKRGLLAPCSGVVMGAPKKEDVNKEWLRDQSAPFCAVGDPAKLILLVPVSPHDFQVLRNDLAELKELEVTILVPGRGTDYARGRLVRLPESDAKDVPLALTQKGGGPLAVKPQAGPDPNVNVPQSQQYLVQVEIAQPDNSICPGTLVQAKVRCRWRTCAWWVWHKISSAFDLGLI
jgi:putative peptide zinc metalloprotease protein